MPSASRCRSSAGRRSCRGFALLLLIVGGTVAGCGKPAPPPPRSRQEIFAERRSLPALYMSESGRRVIAPGDKVVFVDPESGEICWRAMACRAPTCPGRGPNGEPFLCIEGDPTYFRKGDGTLGIDPGRAKGKSKRIGFCPKCNEIRDPSKETAADAERYTQWVQPYELPEHAATLAALDDEMQRRVDLERRHRFTPLPEPEQPEAEQPKAP